MPTIIDIVNCYLYVSLYVYVICYFEMIVNVIIVRSISQSAISETLYQYHWVLNLQLPNILDNYSNDDRLIYIVNSFRIDCEFSWRLVYFKSHNSISETYYTTRRWILNFLVLKLY